MAKLLIRIAVALLLFTNCQASAQENMQPDNRAIELLVAYQSINYFADSLNLISHPDQLPNILSDYLLDWRITNGVCTYVTPINLSFRKAIFDRVFREDVLQWIIESKNPTYDLLYDPKKLKEQNEHSATMIYHQKEIGYCQLPFMSFSIRDLARARLAAMRANKQRINR
jgi:hypothetical protein